MWGKISFTAIGGGQEIGANCYHLNIDGTGIILDAGLHPLKKDNEALPNFSLLNDLQSDIVLISHAHTDHIGALPYLIQQIPHLKIFTSPQTRDLAELMLHNSLAIVQKEIIDGDPLPKSTHEQVDLLTESINPLVYNHPFQLQGYRGNSEVTITLFDAGHVLGSAGILIENEHLRVFYTGDTCTPKQSLLAGADYPDEPVDVLILECTSGATGTLAKRSDEAKRLAKSVNKIIDKGGSILIPIFALGKFQETLTLLHTMMSKGSIPHVDIYTSGMACEISDVYDLHRYNTKRIKKDFSIKEIPQLPVIQEELLTAKYFRTPSIVLASSGMMIEGTTSFALAQRWLKEKNFGIFFVGYIDPLTPANKVLNSKVRGTIQLIDTSDKIKVACEMETFRLTSHSNRDELIDVVKRLNPKTVILVHGEKDGYGWMGREILTRFPKTRVILPEVGKEYKIES
jgi:cleavage and polyadenylation specificity factor subunit 3